MSRNQGRRKALDEVMTEGERRSWTTLWDRQNRRVLLLAWPPNREHNAFVHQDAQASIAGVYDIWRAGTEIVFVEIRLDEHDKPLGFPEYLVSSSLLGSPTIWPMPDLPSFIWWHSAM
jgi:hypothetical protein